MKKFGLHLLLTTFICLVLANCRHNIEEEPTPVIPCQYDSSIDEMKKWYYFEEGTQWIYQEQTTGELDTATVYDSNEGDFWFDYYVFHSEGGWINHYSFDTSWSIYCLTSKLCECHKVNKSKFRPGDFIGEANIFIYPNIVGNYNNIVGFPNGQLTSGSTTLTNVDLQFVIGNDTIEEVIRWDVTADQSISGWPAHYQIGKNRGILKMEFPHTNEEWNLIEYEITQ